MVRDQSIDYCHAETLQHTPVGLTVLQATLKRGFDIVGAVVGLVLTCWLFPLVWLAATLDTRTNGFFLQERVGQRGQHFRVIKLRTMRVDVGLPTTVTTAADARITPLGRFLRRVKLDELPQLINILKGEMSFVGPRPDVPGYADELTGDDRIVLSVRPGITGPATLKYRDEEALLATVADPETYNREVIWPDKVRINRAYIENWSFWQDLIFIWRTLVS